MMGGSFSDPRRSSYDSAKTTKENKNHWAEADALDARAANSPEVRKTLRERARCERDNNGYCSGLIETIADDLVGTGPTAQFRIPGLDDDATALVERNFWVWTQAIGLATKLQILEMSALCDGEGFGVLVTNPAVADHWLNPRVQLDLRLYECDQCGDAILDPASLNAVDGIRFDDHGNRTEYRFFKAHPGGQTVLSSYLETEPIPARDVIHWFKRKRAGQERGVPEITPALPLFAQLRRYTLAVLSAAELAACIAGVLKTNLPVPSEVVNGDTTLFDEINIVRNKLLTLSDGWDISQLKPEQPTNTYPDFKRELLNEIGRPLQAPFNVVSGNSSGYNYSSGRLDHQLYHRSLRGKRRRLEQEVLDRCLVAWFNEASMVPGLLPEGLPPLAAWTWSWQWDGFGSIDPVKEANANETRLASGQTTLAEIAAAEGKDWEERMEQRARERRKAESLGYPDLADAPRSGGNSASRDPQEQESAA
jgi:lambda family phage portal protein